METSETIFWRLVRPVSSVRTPVDCAGVGRTLHSLQPSIYYDPIRPPTLHTQKIIFPIAKMLTVDTEVDQSLDVNFVLYVS